VTTAYHSTGIPTIEVYTALPRRAPLALRASRYAGRLLGSSLVQRFLRGRIQRQPPGPSEEERRRGKSLLWGEVKDGRGERVAARLSGPEGYSMTVGTALLILEKVLAGDVKPGFQTPSRAYGAGFILGLDGVTRELAP
jgi:short subunit dehydrogenase-like uncharacterized protein